MTNENIRLDKIAKLDKMISELNIVLTREDKKEYEYMDRQYIENYHNSLTTVLNHAKDTLRDCPTSDEVFTAIEGSSRLADDVIEHRQATDDSDVMKAITDDLSVIRKCTDFTRDITKRLMRGL